MRAIEKQIIKWSCSLSPNRVANGRAFQICLNQSTKDTIFLLLSRSAIITCTSSKYFKNTFCFVLWSINELHGYGSINASFDFFCFAPPSPHIHNKLLFVLYAVRKTNTEKYPHKIVISIIDNDMKQITNNAVFSVVGKLLLISTLCTRFTGLVCTVLPPLISAGHRYYG